MKRWLKFIAIVGLLGLFVLGGIYLYLDRIFSLGSNFVYKAFMHSDEPVKVHVGGSKWKPLSDVAFSEFWPHIQVISEDETAKHYRVHIKRTPKGVGQQVTGRLFACEVNVFEFSHEHYQLETIFEPGFPMMTAQEAAGRGNFDFVINGNFYDEFDRPLGLVIHEERVYNSRMEAWSGILFTRGGRTFFGPKSLDEDTATLGPMTQAIQSYPALMKNHHVFDYVNLEPNKYFNGERITFRSLAGTKSNDTLIFVVSGNGGVLNVPEIALLAQKLGVKHATLLDGGRSLQYLYQAGKGRDYFFHSFNNTVEMAEYPNLNLVQCPVYLGLAKK